MRRLGFKFQSFSWVLILNVSFQSFDVRTYFFRTEKSCTLYSLSKNSNLLAELSLKIEYVQLFSLNYLVMVWRGVERPTFFKILPNVHRYSVLIKLLKTSNFV